MVNKQLKKFDEKIVPISIFVLLFFALGILFVANPTFTGFVVLEDYTNESDCVAAGYAWENSTGQNCTNLTTCINETIDCEPCLEYEDINGTQGDCINWTSCINETCTSEENCTEIVIGQCVGNICGDGVIQNPNDDGINEICDDGSNNGEYNYCKIDCLAEGPFCGDENCDGVENCSSCSDDCGECEEESETSEENENAESFSSSDSLITGASTENICASNWNCSEWGECLEGIQNRTCEDINNCDPLNNIIETTQFCKMEKTCFDKMKNQNEEGIDCGGVCEERCGIFTIVGSVVSGPIESGREFIQKNRTISLIILGVIVLAGGFIIFRFFKKNSGKPKETS